MSRFVIGIGCERGIRPWALRDGVHTVLSKNNIQSKNCSVLASITRKRNEPAILNLAGLWNLQTVWYSPETLSQISNSVPNPSDVVEQSVGTPSVAEASALNACPGDDLLLPKVVSRPFRRAFTLAVVQSNATQR